MAEKKTTEEVNVPKLEGWVNITEAAEIAGISRQYSYRLAKRTMQGKKGGWATLHQVGNKLIHVVQASEAEERRKANIEAMKRAAEKEAQENSSE